MSFPLGIPGVAPQFGSDAIVLQTEGASFEAILGVAPGAQVYWSFGDGQVATGAHPSVVFGAASTRRNRLRVVPWAALETINLGFDAFDGGDDARYGTPFDVLPAQLVSSIERLQLATSLARLALSSTPSLGSGSSQLVTSLDLSSLASLTQVEATRIDSLVSVDLSGLTSLVRGAFEGPAGKTILHSLDFSACPLLIDVRGADNGLTSFALPLTPLTAMWHLCIRDNPNLATQLPDLSLFAALTQCWIWNCNQSGELRIGADGMQSLLAYSNNYTALDLSAATLVGNVEVQDCAIATIDFGSCDGLVTFKAQNNALSSSQVDAALVYIDSLGRNNGECNLTGNAAPTAIGLAARASLIGRGFTVLVDP